MRILAVDTSSFPASVAILEDGIILGESVIRNQRKHSQNLMQMTEKLFDDLGMDISEIDIFSVTVGPGSFTGLRIGISSVRAFAQAMNKPVIGVNTLEALAYNLACCDKVVIPMLDARRNEVFTAAYKFENGVINEVIAPCVMTIGELNEEFKNKSVIYVGDGAIAHKDELADGDFATANLMEVRASSVAALAYTKADKGSHYNEIQPLYLRKSQAERELEEKEKIK